MARFGRGSEKSGYTLVEMLVATTLTLIMMGGVATVFGMIGAGVSSARASLEMADALRAAAQRLRADLDGVTVIMSPPRRPEAGEGYFEYIEGPFGPDSGNAPSYIDSDSGGGDTTVGDTDDILLVTTRSPGEPFVGRYAANPVESPDAEVIWFVRGRMLYRRVLLVRPDLSLASESAAGFYNRNDLSARIDRDSNGNPVLVANSLADLTKRECRYAHHYRAAAMAGDDVFPFSASRWGQLRLPTLGESSHGNWTVDGMNPATTTVVPVNTIDLWTNPYPWNGVDPETGTLNNYPGPRIGEDVILSNVISFDVKAWDPGAPVRSDGTVVLLPGDSNYPGGVGYSNIAYGAYVDLGYYAAVNPSLSAFSGNGATTGLVRVYDTWSDHYENDGIDQNSSGAADEGRNGFDDDVNGVVDDAGESEAPPPYAAPLRGIQIKIRVFEPDSRQIREVTIVHDFLPK